MRKAGRFQCILASSLLLLSACGKEEGAAVDQGVGEATLESEPAESVSNVSSAVPAEWEGSHNASTSSASESESTDELTDELARLEENLADLENKALEQSQSARAKLIEKLQRLRQKRDELSDKADALQEEGHQAWDDVFSRVNEKLGGISREIEPAAEQQAE